MRVLVYHLTRRDALGGMEGLSVGVTAPDVAGMCWLMWWSAGRDPEVLGNRDQAACDDYLLRRFDRWVSDGWIPSAEPVVVETAEPPMWTGPPSSGVEFREWARVALKSAGLSSHGLELTFQLSDVSSDLVGLLFGGSS